MRGLYVSIQTPSPLASDGGGQAAFQYLQTISQLHEIDVVTSVKPGRAEWIEPLRAVARETIAIPWNPSPFVRAAQAAWGFARSGRLFPLLNRPLIDAAHARMAAQRYDFVQADWSELAYWIRPPKGTRFLSCFIDVRARVLEERLRRVATPRERSACRKSLRRAAWEERQLLKRLDAALALSESDVRWLRAQSEGRPVFRTIYRQANAEAAIPSWDEREPGRLLYSGDYSRPENRAVAERLIDAVPHIRVCAPHARLRLVGGGAPAGWAARAEQRGAVFTGYSASLDSEYRAASFFLAPIEHRGGIFVKLIEAMSWAVPVLTTPLGNEGIEAPPDEAVVLCDSIEDMAEKASYLLCHSEQAQAIGLAGRRHALERFGPAQAMAIAREVFHSL